MTRRITLLLLLSIFLSGCGIYIGTSPPQQQQTTVPTQSTAQQSTQQSTLSFTAQGQSNVQETTSNTTQPRVPSQSEINNALSSIGRGYDPLSSVTASDGNGGYLMAVVGLLRGTADGYGQSVFFWHNDQYVGQDTVSTQQRTGPFFSLSANGNKIEVTTPVWPNGMSLGELSREYHYGQLPAITISFWWNGSSLQHS